VRPRRVVTGSLVCAVLLGCAAAPASEWATEDDVVRLEPGALAGDRAAIRALFELRADGAVAEAIDVVLGSTIRPWPALFLQELQRCERRRGPWELDGLLGNNGPALVDEFELQRRESLLRIAALQSVGAAELAELRDRCIAKLREDAAQLGEWLGTPDAAMTAGADRLRGAIERLAVHGTTAARACS
jgi:hypothetical protein